jgi:uncharacterized phiE125 gp8 family phage protein
MALPVSISDARAQLQLGSDTSRDDELERFIADAAGWVESYTGHILEARGVTEQFRGFDAVELHAWPIAAASPLTVTFTDANGGSATVIGAALDISRRPARVLRPLGSYWPRAQLFTATVRAGYEAPDDVPRDLRRAMLVLIAGYDSDREGGEIFAKAEDTARRLCRRYRIHRL